MSMHEPDGAQGPDPIRSRPFLTRLWGSGRLEYAVVSLGSVTLAMVAVTWAVWWPSLFFGLIMLFQGLLVWGMTRSTRSTIRSVLPLVVTGRCRS